MHGRPVPLTAEDEKIKEDENEHQYTEIYACSPAGDLRTLRPGGRLGLSWQECVATWTGRSLMSMALLVSQLAAHCT